MLDKQIEDMESTDLSRDVLEQAFRNLWTENGNSLSRFYAGTDAMHTDFTRARRRLFGGKFADLRSSITRFYLNFFEDGTRQDAIDLLVLGTLSRGESRPRERGTSLKDLVAGAILWSRPGYPPPHSILGLIYCAFWVISTSFLARLINLEDRLRSEPVKADPALVQM
jgi:hypothetical protein